MKSYSFLEQMGCIAKPSNNKNQKTIFGIS